MNFDRPLPVEPFFILEECRDLFIRRLVDIAQQSGIIQPPVLDAMRREAAEAHDELAAETSPEGFDQTQGLTASRISLLGHDDLEIDIRIGEIASHLRDDQRIDHWRVQLRYMSLLQRPAMPPEQNPLGMEPIRRALWAICREGGGSLEQQFGRLDNLEETLKLRLPGVYAELNQLLESKGIAPAQTQLIRQPASRAVVSASPTNSPTNPLAMLQLTMQQQRGDNAPAGAAAPGGANASAGGNALVRIENATTHGPEERDIAFTLGSYDLAFKGMDYLVGFALPNFYFHMVTAYNILRENGVEIGKRDFLAREEK